MALNRYRELVCDSCDSCDVEPTELFGDTYGVVNRKRAKELATFILCAECSSEYPKGAKDFYVPEMFENQICDECEQDADPDADIDYSGWVTCSNCK